LLIADLRLLISKFGPWGCPFRPFCRNVRKLESVSATVETLARE
jgi:hypothetical protein